MGLTTFNLTDIWDEDVSMWDKRKEREEKEMAMRKTDDRRR